MKKNRGKYNFIEWTVLILFLISPFVMSFGDKEIGMLLNARMLPSIITNSADLLRWAGLAILVIFSLMKIRERTKFFRFTFPVVMLSAFYFTQLLYALIDGTDILRFFFLSILSLLAPPSIGYIMVKRPIFQRYFVYIIFFFLVLSILLNGHLVLAGQRFFGFMNNPNAYGISAVFWMVILLLADRNKMINKKLFLIVFVTIIITMLFSGSRNGFIGLFLVVLLNYFTKLKRLLYVTMIVVLALIIVTYFIDLNFVFDRFFNISNSFNDSGRSVLWQRAYFSLEQNLWWGYGMDANYSILNTGNVHNCYIRFVLNMGLIFTIVALFFYFWSIAVTFRKNNIIPLILPSFLIAYALMNIGEDYFVGIGSSAYLYILYIFGFINSYLIKGNLQKIKTNII